MQIADLRFLVAEDQQLQRTLLVNMLASLGAKSILEATDGRSALEIILDRPIDIVITDLAMPGMDGIELIRHLSEAEVPVSAILISVLERSLIASVETMAAAYGVTVLGTIKKPTTPEELKELINLHTRGAAMRRGSTAAAPTFTQDEIVDGLKNDEFEPFFQPKIELATGQVKGAEALARWRHPKHRIVAPYAFIAQLERNDLIDTLTWIILRKAVACCSRWHTAGLEGTVSVNLSIKSLTDPQFAQRVTEFVRSQKLELSHVVLEVTESATTTQTGQALENLARLRMNGFGLSIDDYGTGYSSMQQLARIAFTELKVDQSFVRNVITQKSSQIILESSLHLAKKLGITAVAEGVETQKEWDLLLQLDCDLAQGYFIAQPMQAEVYPDWIRDWMHTH